MRAYPWNVATVRGRLANKAGFAVVPPLFIRQGVSIPLSQELQFPPFVKEGLGHCYCAVFPDPETSMHLSRFYSLGHEDHSHFSVAETRTREELGESKCAGHVEHVYFSHSNSTHIALSSTFTSCCNFPC